MAKGTTYYYFRIRRPNVTDIIPYGIKESTIYINDNIMLNFKKMTDEQREFYFANPTASVMEVWNCELIPPYVPPTPDVEEYKNNKIYELQNACYGSIKITSLEYSMAMDKVHNHNVTADSYYTLIQATQVLKDFRSQSKHAMEVLSAYKPQIEIATTIDAINVIYNEAITKL